MCFCALTGGQAADGRVAGPRRRRASRGVGPPGQPPGERVQRLHLSGVGVGKGKEKRTMRGNKQQREGGAGYARAEEGRRL